MNNKYSDLSDMMLDILNELANTPTLTNMDGLMPFKEIMNIMKKFDSLKNNQFASIYSKIMEEGVVKRSIDIIGEDIIYFRMISNNEIVDMKFYDKKSTIDILIRYSDRSGSTMSQITMLNPNVELRKIDWNHIQGGMRCYNMLLDFIHDVRKNDDALKGFMLYDLENKNKEEM